MLRGSRWLVCLCHSVNRVRQASCSVTPPYGKVRDMSFGNADFALDSDGSIGSIPFVGPCCPSPRDIAVAELSNVVFGKGNMHLKNVETLSALPEGLHSFPEVCFIGKPNVGKSTLISCLLHNRRLGRAGRTPGTTRLLEFFNVGDALLLVDTPGYGGWRGRDLAQPLAVRANAFAILFRYLAIRKNGNLKRVYLVMEASAHGPVSIQPRDEEMLFFLQREQIPFSVVLTKIDRHWRYFLEQQNKATHCAGARIPRMNPAGVLPSQTIPTPEEGVQRNMAEITAFIGSTDVPIIGVSANRLKPDRCRNLTPLQHDIVHYCTLDLPRMEDLTYKEFKRLSYAPPTADEIQATQVKYPVESFFVPQQNNLSLAAMVDRHECSKSRYISQNPSCRHLTARDVAESGLQPAPLYHPLGVEGGDDSVCTNGKAKCTRIEEAGVLTVPPSVGDELTARCSSLADGTPCGNSQVGFLRRPCLWRSQNGDANMTADKNPERAICGGREEDVATAAPNPDCGTESRANQSATVLLGAPVLIWGQGEHTHTVTSINGVQIPRSLIPTSVLQVAVKKEDEMPAFAERSGAGAYEELLAHDCLPSATGDPFMETTDHALLPEHAQDSLQRLEGQSSFQRRRKMMLRKYIDKERKERSIYMQAEGYMCPWLAGASQSGRVAVLGMEGGPHSVRGGALMKGLKSSGFGGRSYSARTMKNRGRATKKTGAWAS